MTSRIAYCLFVLLHGWACAAHSLKPTSSPPLLDVPTYSLATFNKDGSTNMNIMTYATPVSVRPDRVWSLGLYRETLTEENLLRNPTGVLQLLTREHAKAVSILGGGSGRDVDKREACAELGLDWLECEELDGIHVLPGCAHYLKVRIQGGLVDAGSHLIVPYCEVESMYTAGSEAKCEEHLKTSCLRELGIITDLGRVADVERDVANRGFRLE